MTTNFDSVQTLKSSEDCGKFSKSVSYETLVGGTTTTGTEKKQTRRVFLSSADKPLSAVGTLTSLLCNSAKVMEKLFYRHSEPKDSLHRHPERSEGSIKTGTVMPDLLGHLSRIKKEAAEFAFGAASQAPYLGSRLLSCPRMTIF